MFNSSASVRNGSGVAASIAPLEAATTPILPMHAFDLRAATTLRDARAPRAILHYSRKCLPALAPSFFPFIKLAGRTRRFGSRRLEQRDREQGFAAPNRRHLGTSMRQSQGSRAERSHCAQPCDQLSERLVRAAFRPQAPRTAEVVRDMSSHPCKSLFWRKIRCSSTFLFW